MYKTLDEFNNAVCDYLSDLVAGYGLLPEFYEKCFVDDTLDVIAYCAECKYVMNVYVYKDGDGKYHASTDGEVRITRDGLAFIEDYNDTALKKIKHKANMANIKSWIAIYTSIAAVIATVVLGLMNSN